ncbi:hypothetical protein B0H34DRAFT_213414 [Crassisporium funariophilum]|nr:hypothetical protein B0H34DRAFT_213414 [Crassisporium funariophilum]
MMALDSWPIAQTVRATFAPPIDFCIIVGGWLTSVVLYAPAALLIWRRIRRNGCLFEDNSRSRSFVDFDWRG